MVVSHRPDNLATNGHKFHNSQYPRSGWSSQGPLILSLPELDILTMRSGFVWFSDFKMSTNETTRGSSLLDGVTTDPLKLVLIPLATVIFWFTLQQLTSPMRKYPGPILGGRSPSPQRRLISRCSLDQLLSHVSRLQWPDAHSQQETTRQIWSSGANGAKLHRCRLHLSH